MKQNVLKQAADYNKKRRKKARRYKVLSVLAAFVVFCTTYSLIMPAITMENPQCGLEEHIHGTDCYETVLTCGQEESADGHVHDDSCYEVTYVDELTCGEVESEGHTHDDSCYTVETVTKYKTVTEDIVETVTVEDTEERDILDEEGNVIGSETVVTGSYEEEQVVGTREIEVEDGTEEVETLTCGETESAGHTHDDSCYSQVEQQVLVCEEAEAHTHSDACYEQVLTCEKTEHTHTDECYEAPEDSDIEDPDSSAVDSEDPDSSAVDGEEVKDPEDGEDAGIEDGEEVKDPEDADLENPEEEDLVDLTEEEVPKTMLDALLKTLAEKIAAGLTNDEGYLIDEFGELVLDENGEPIKIQKNAIEAEEIVYTQSNEYYQAVYHVNYNGNLFEDDELAFSAENINFADDESDRFYDYMGAMDPEAIVQPICRDEYALTLNGEEVDRSEYDVSVEIIPSRMMMAGLVNLQMTQPATADERYEDEDSQEDKVETMPGFALAELINGELSETASLVVDLDELGDMNVYMSEMYALDENGDYAVDENGNPVLHYDRNYAFVAEVSDVDFLVVAGLTANPIETLASVSQKAWSDGLKVLWDGYTPSGSSGSHKADEKVVSVTMTHSDSKGVKDSNAQEVKIWEGTANRTTYSVSYDGTGEYNDGNTSIGDKRVLLKGSSTSTTEWVECDPAEADRITVNYEYPNYAGTSISSGSQTITNKSSNNWTKALTIQPGDVWGTTVVYGSGMIYRPSKTVNQTVTSVKYEKQVTSTTTTPAIYPDATTNKIDYALLEIEPEPGYYITQVVIACTNGNSMMPTQCTVWTDKAGVFESVFGVSNGTHVSLTVPSTAFCHYGSQYTENANDTYYILIATAPIPSPLFVSYEPGNIAEFGMSTNNTEFSGKNWLDGGRTTVADNNVLNATTVDQLKKAKSSANWSEGELDYYVSGISPDAEGVANARGYRFTGWRLEYWGNVTENIKTAYTTEDQVQAVASQFPTYSSSATTNEKNGFAGDLFIPKNEISQYRYLMTNAKLIAQWEPIPAAEIEKQVTGLEGTSVEINQERTYQFTIASSDNSDFSFKATVPTYTFVNGIAIPGTETKDVSSSNGVATVEFSVYGNSSRSYQISGMAAKADVTYTVTEVNENGTGYRTSYANNVRTFTVENTSTVTQAQTVKVINDYTPNRGYTMTLEKVAPKTGVDVPEGTLPGSATAVNAEGNWMGLPGAVFKLEVKTDDGWKTVTDDLTSSSANLEVGAVATAELEYEKLYRLTETSTVSGYNLMPGSIYFKAATGDSIVLCEEDGSTSASQSNKNVSVDADHMKLIVANYGGYALPSTGGEGTLMYTLSGGMLIMMAGLALVYTKSQRKGGRAS